ncbi:MAG TPA: tetratricopeptide repeat protein [Candidatus Omnitrophota bacterium]|nr:tetratricopeptide repeat protein [Candidatus Omnitrophota bacterium]HNQ50043.1 tetratricopeptide repeat protein [Candidatus Omnitrophota bacterium]HQO37284.1 tetratricopeptide repeat protein [Candidatus Omnitrophota bacterium]HQQ05818.1 tetratricopeptide repeat protein [Candidatus Omnitrophota bacterium]
MDRHSYITYFKRSSAIVLLIILFLEAGLRAEGRIKAFLREYTNRQAVRLKGDYRILCLGESTTSCQYPRFLEDALNRRGLGVRFRVIDKGSPAVSSIDIASNVRTYLDEYRPDLVVSMMGINDRDSALPRGTGTHSEIVRFILSMRTYKLAKLLLLRMLPGSGEGSSTEYDSTERALKRDIASKPFLDTAYRELGHFYKMHHRFLQAEEMYRRALEIDPDNDTTCAELGHIYADRRMFSRAAALFKKALFLNRRNEKAYLGFGVIHREHGDDRQAEVLFKKGRDLNPRDDLAYFYLAELYRRQGRLAKAAAAFERIIELNPRNKLVYVELGWLYRDQGKYAQAEDVLRKGMIAHPRDDRALGALVSLYEATGEYELAREYDKKLRSARSDYYLPVTVANYHALKDILDERGTRLVCAQYPMRPVAPLKKIFEGGKDVIFVDNEAVFKKAVAEMGVKGVFTDMFAGDFGHCTNEGNRLLASNIADGIIKGVFGR